MGVNYEKEWRLLYAKLKEAVRVAKEQKKKGKIITVGEILERQRKKRET